MISCSVRYANVDGLTLPQHGEPIRKGVLSGGERKL